MKTVIIGTGNLGHALARKIRGSSHDLVQVVGRNTIQGEKISKELEVPFVHGIGGINKDAQLYIVAINDDSLMSIGQWLQLGRKLVVHTAGSVSKEVLKSVSKNYGVLYPLQSLKGEMEVLPEIPFLIDGNTPDDLALISDFAFSLSDKVEIADDEARRKLHLAAVFVNNFTNHLYALAARYCEEEKLDFRFLHPLIRQTAYRLSYMNAKDAQTGAALRNDESTIATHETLLNAYPEMKEIYAKLTESISKFHKSES